MSLSKTFLTCPLFGVGALNHRDDYGQIWDHLGRGHGRIWRNPCSPIECIHALAQGWMLASFQEIVRIIASLSHGTTRVEPWEGAAAVLVMLLFRSTVGNFFLNGLCTWFCWSDMYLITIVYKFAVCPSRHKLALQIKNMLPSLLRWSHLFEPAICSQSVRACQT